VTFAGALGPDAVLGRLQGADVFLHSSSSEGISNAVLEAMACGLPVVTTDVGGMAEAVRDGVDGHVVAPRDVAAAAEALTRLAGDPEGRKRMGDSARERVRDRFDLAHQLDAFCELFTTLADGSR
jgi:glycosyltransferase involved in cell wall biosynthesis